MSPIVAPGPGSSYAAFRNIPEGRRCSLTLTGKKRGILLHQVLIEAIIHVTRTDLFLSTSRLHPSTELLLDRRGPNPPLARTISLYMQDSFSMPYRESRESCPSRTYLCISHRPGTTRYGSVHRTRIDGVTRTALKFPPDSNLPNKV